MKKITILSILVLCGLMISPKSAFSQHIEWADIFITPDPATPNTIPIGGFLGGDGNVNPNNDWISWSVGNCVPWSGTPTKNLVISTCEGDFMSATTWHPRMCITKEGNVGIGTTTPGNSVSLGGQIGGIPKLDVKGRISAGENLGPADLSDFGIPAGSANFYNVLTASSGEAGVGFVRGRHIMSPVIYMYDHSAYGNSFTIGKLPWMGNPSTDIIPLITVQRTGNVGIGTTEPASKLHIHNPSGGTSMRISNQNNYGARMGAWTSANAFNFDPLANNGEFWFGRDTPLSKFIITTGNVGIGTTEPFEKLEVEGNVKAWGYITGDITFQKDGKPLWRMFEDENGLYLESLSTGEIYRFVLEKVEK